MQIGLENIINIGYFKTSFAVDLVTNPKYAGATKMSFEIRSLFTLGY